MKGSGLNQKDSTIISNEKLDEDLLYLQISLLICSVLVVLLLISPKSSFMAIYSAILLIAAVFLSTSIVISSSSVSKIKEIEYLILTSGISVIGSFFCGIFLVKANFLPPDYMVLEVFPGLYYYLISFLLVCLGVFSSAVFIKNISIWIRNKEKLQIENSNIVS
ncbi:MAG: hypothetical protein KAR35_06230 [Candidatus Heimdallarchaeota archaeon]|nr:hypothetical protein [Candidatus Heimdallarchaeota archaeon]MCK5048956.1 hypothetical protein [Candidatus Heimdallarchaeota archaeon]